VDELPGTGEPGVHFVEVTNYIGTEWQKLQSLTKGTEYFFNVRTGEKQFKEPSDVKKAIAIEPGKTEYAVEFAERPPGWPLKRMKCFDVRCNSFQVNGPLLKAQVHEYVISFEPDVKQEDVGQRHAILFGKLGNGDKLRSVFGEFSFDNTRLFALGDGLSEVPSVDFKDLHEKTSVHFTRTESYSITDTKLPLEQVEALLNIFNRKRLFAANFTRIGNAYFEKGSLRDEHVIRGRDSCPDVSVLRGFDCSIRLMPRDKSKKELAILKVDTCTKLIEASSIHDMLEELFHRCNGDQRDFEARAQKELEGKHFMLTYSKRGFTINRVDFRQTEASTFDKKGEEVSYAKYLRDTYKLASPKKERCVLLDRKDSAFLPQHSRLTVSLATAAPIGTEIHEATNPRIEDRFREIDAFVKKVSSVKSEAFTIGGPVSTKALSLSYPRITYRGRSGEQTANLMELRWSDNCGFLGKTSKIKSWVIVYSSYHQRAADSLYEAWRTYCGKRKLDMRSGPLPEPDMYELRRDSDERDWSTAISRKPDLVVIVINDAMEGSEMKARFTRFVQSKIPVPLQFIKSSTCNRGSAALGAFDDIMAKSGNVLFECDPVLPFGSSIDLKSTWMIGVDVSHNSGKPSVVSACLMRTPMVGSVHGVHCMSHLQECRKEIMSFEHARNLFFQLLKEGIEHAQAEGAPLPTAIIVYRDAVADSQLRELASKEVAGVQRALNDLRSGAKKWRCALEYLTCSRNCIDRFAEFDDRRRGLVNVEEPCAIYDHVMSYRLFDFVVFPYHPKKRHKCRAVRYIVVHDGMELARKSEGAVDLMQLTFALSYVYVFTIPFPLGGTSSPAPIQYAKHYAEMGAQMIFKTDHQINDLRLHPKMLAHPRIADYRQLETLEKKRSAMDITERLSDATLRSAD
jgi:hypothetical protein